MSSQDVTDGLVILRNTESLGKPSILHFALTSMATPSREEPEGLFDIDEIDGNSPPPEKQCSQSPEHPTDKASSSTGINEDIELSRRAVPVVEVEEDVCSICLDEFTAEDPEQRTSCECVPKTSGVVSL